MTLLFRDGISYGDSNNSGKASTSPRQWPAPLILSYYPDLPLSGLHAVTSSLPTPGLYFLKMTKPLDLAKQPKSLSHFQIPLTGLSLYVDPLPMSSSQPSHIKAQMPDLDILHSLEGGYVKILLVRII